MNIRNKDISNVVRIQGTNDNSILSKGSMIKFGYFNDPFLPYMIGKFSRRAPLINRGYYIRAKAIDFFLHDFLNHYKGQRVQIVSLGAGFDTSFFRLFHENQLNSCVFVEIDYFDVAQRKVRLMKQEAALWGCLQEPLSMEVDNYIVLNAANYKLLGVDLTKLDMLDACIRASGVSYDLPTLFLSECVLTYVSTKKALMLLKFIAKAFSENCFVLYEQIYPDDGFGQFMCHHFQQLGSSLRGISKYKTKADQIKRFLDAGWETARGCDMAEFYYDSVSDEEKARVESLEVFDEYEEWLQKCTHYLLLVATRGSSWAPRLTDREVPAIVEAVVPLHHFPYERDATEMVIGGGVKAHHVRCAVVRSPGGRECLVRAGGYGQGPFQTGHCRLSSVSMLDLASARMTHVQPDDRDLLLGSLCGSMSQISSGSFILFGGRSSPLKPNNSALRLDVSLSGDDWKAACTEIEFPHPSSVPSPRWRHSAGTYWIGDRPFLLVHGGRGASPWPLGDTHTLDLLSLQWAPQTGLPSPGPLCSGATVSLGTPSCKNPSPEECCGCCCLIVIGGLRSARLTPSGLLWRWCGRKRLWTPLTTTTTVAMTPLFSHTAHLLVPRACGVSKATVAVLGGVSDQSPVCGLSLVTVDLLAGTARVRSLPLEDRGAREAVMLFNHGSALSGDGRLWLVGGGGNCFSFGTQLNEHLYFLKTGGPLAL